MSTNWETYRRRAAALQEVVRTLDMTGSDEVPWTEATAAVFAGPDDVLVALHDLWTRRLQSRIDLELETDNGQMIDGAANAWHSVAAELPGVRRVLDRYENHPSLDHHERSEHRLLAVAAGLATLGDPISRSARLGADFVRSIRITGAPAPFRRPPLVARLREALTV